MTVNSSVSGSSAGGARSNAGLALALVALFALLPYGVSFALGEADPELAGWGAVQSRAASVFCEPGQNPAGLTMAVALGVLIVAWLAAQAWGDRWLTVLGATLKQEGFYIVVLVLAMSIPFFLAWGTDSSACKRGEAFFWQTIFIDVYILSILAVSYNLLFGFTGIVSFGHSAFFGMGAYMVGVFVNTFEWHWALAIVGALIVGLLIAVVKGVVGLRIKGLYFALFTLAFSEVFFLMAGNRLLTEITGAEDGFTFAVPEFLNITTNRLFFYYMTLVLFVASFLLVRLLMNSPTGQVLRGLRDNEERAQMLGYNTFRFKLLSILISGFLATGAGVLRGIEIKGASPAVLSTTYTFDPLLATIIGGTATFTGPVLGTVGLHLLEEFLRNQVLTFGEITINIGERWALILGVIFIIIVLAFPQGVVGTFMAQRLNTLAGWKKLLRLERNTN